MLKERIDQSMGKGKPRNTHSHCLCIVPAGTAPLNHLELSICGYDAGATTKRCSEGVGWLTDTAPRDCYVVVNASHASFTLW
jgi:hypothetical protein